MTIKYKCEGCGSVLKIKDELAGKDGSCPKCKATFVIPAPEGSRREAKSAAQDTSEKAPEADDDDDDMFGKDFFKLSEVPTRPKFIAPPITDNDDEDAAPKKGLAPKSTPANPPLPSQNSTDAAANIAGQLLAKTGKKNKTAAMEMAELEAEQQAEKVDLTELKYQLTHKVLPIIGGGLIAIFGLYFLISSMFNDKSKIPPLARVSGIVTVDGKPAGNIDVRFFPQAANPGDVAKGSLSYATTDAQGSYTLNYNVNHQGAVVGKHKVELAYPGRQLTKDVEVKEGSNDIPLAF